MPNFIVKIKPTTIPVPYMHQIKGTRQHTGSEQPISGITRQPNGIPRCVTDPHPGASPFPEPLDPGSVTIFSESRIRIQLR
jgi:hypothetical protein